MAEVCASCGAPTKLRCDGEIWTNPFGKRFRVPSGTRGAGFVFCDAPVCFNCCTVASGMRTLCLDCAKAQEGPVEISK
jgi:hypothetical protein